MRYLRLIFWFLTAAYWVLVATLTHLPPDHLPHVTVSDKLQHFLAYSALAGLLSMAIWVTFPRRPWLVWTVLVVGLAYGAMDELTQPMFGRTCDINDWFADAVGTITGILPVIVFQRLYFRSLRRNASPPPAGENLGPEVEAALRMFADEAPAGGQG